MFLNNSSNRRIDNMYVLNYGRVFYLCIFSLIGLNGHTDMQLTRSTCSTLIPNNTSTSVTIESVSACTSMLTRVADTFVGIWNENN